MFFSIVSGDDDIYNRVTSFFLSPEFFYTVSLNLSQTRCSTNPCRSCSPNSFCLDWALRFLVLETGMVDLWWINLQQNIARIIKWSTPNIYKNWIIWITASNKFLKIYQIKYNANGWCNLSNSKRSGFSYLVRRS